MLAIELKISEFLGGRHMATLASECLTSVIRLKEMLEISSSFPTGDTNTYINLIKYEGFVRIAFG